MNKLLEILKAKTPDWEIQTLNDPLVLNAIIEWLEANRSSWKLTCPSDEYKGRMNLMDKLLDEANKALGS